jgi:histidinol dehydrogenase
MTNIMQIIKYPERSDWNELCKRPVQETGPIEKIVGEILQDIRIRGDEAVRLHTERIDKISLNDFKVTSAEIDDAIRNVPDNLRKAIVLAAKNIEKFHASQKIQGKVIETVSGVKCWQKAVAIEKIGLYIPGGTAPLFSTVLMLGIPAVIAGCKEIVICTPPGKDGKINPAILYTANLIGIKHIFKIGGVMAVGAMAYGTKIVPAVYKIFGPGNQYVTIAKMMVNREGIAIDMPAGPSEVAVIADDTANPDYVSYDLLSQAEHGKDSQVLLLTTDEKIIEPIMQSIQLNLETLERKEMASASLQNSKCVLFRDKQEMMDFCNEYAPEHLIIETKDYLTLSEKVINAGSVFLGHLTPESAGDYASGTNHTLPTNGHAKTFSGVNLDSYVKKITYQLIEKHGLKSIGSIIELMAENELLTAHKNAVSVRLKSMK